MIFSEWWSGYANTAPGGPSGMREENLKGWLAEAWKEKASAAKAEETEGTTTVLRGTGGEDTEKKRGKEVEEMTN